MKIQNIILHPSKVISYLAWRINCLFLTRVTLNGEIYHKYRGELYPDYLNHGNARSSITDLALKWCVGKGIDVGADEWPLPGAIPIQNDPKQNAYKLDFLDDGSLDYVFSSHCLEHLENWQDALRLWIRKLKLGGILFLYLPHKSMRLWNPRGPWVSSMHKWKPSIEVLLPFLKSNHIEVINYNSGRDAYWSFHIIGKRKPA
ncbi:MAG TPA: methyltransferase domain-containing protein [Candidatus Acidoferrales bacterium]|nr:methyltransferase domain-containing protein [Candidatus Acidoferrales bacterium]